MNGESSLKSKSTNAQVTKTDSTTEEDPNTPKKDVKDLHDPKLKASATKGKPELSNSQKLDKEMNKIIKFLQMNPIQEELKIFKSRKSLEKLLIKVRKAGEKGGEA